MPPPAFLYFTCQVGAEKALKAEVARRFPLFRFSFSRPGFLTFKLPEEHGLAEEFDPELVFARSHGFSLGKVAGETPAELATAALELAGERRFDVVHVWQRDLAAPGHRDFQPGLTKYALEAAAAVEAALLAQSAGSPKEGQSPPDVLAESLCAGSNPAAQVSHSSPRPLSLSSHTPIASPPDLTNLSQTPPINVTARPGQLVLDCVLVEPQQWWVGLHRAAALASCWPGGLAPLTLPSDAVSRAWLKLEEALLWSRLPLREGQTCVEIGCAPGGSCQALLARGLLVIGIDPAEVDPVVAANPHFVHIQKRGHEVRRRDFRKARWLTADMNVAPDYTLDTVEAIVTYPETDIRGMLLTLKLLDWNLAENIPQYLERIRAWGYPHVQARQLQHNRQEICVAASQRPPTHQTLP